MEFDDSNTCFEIVKARKLRRSNQQKSEIVIFSMTTMLLIVLEISNLTRKLVCLTPWGG